MAKLIIDVSEHQGKINWEKAKNQIAGAILRCGYGSDITSQDDKQFKRNADECTRLGIPFGVYLYSYADTEEEARSEAAHVLRLIKGYKLDYPVYYDLEEAGTEKGAVKRAEIFGDIIEKAGYWCGIYANLYWWENHLNALERFTKWVAQYNSTCDYKGANKDIWQYSSMGSVDGISGRVDMNMCYRDFPVEINGAKKPALKSVDVIADECIAGKWGNGSERVRRLMMAGYDATKVQDAVNKKMAKNAKEKKVYHVIKSGDTLSEIAADYGTTVSAIVKLNNLKNPDLIYAGQKIRVK